MIYNISNSKMFNLCGLNSYIFKVNSYPLLSLKKEHQLVGRFYYNGDIIAAKKLIFFHLRFVIYIARNYSGYGLPYADLIQEGNIGLLKAIKKFNPFFGVRIISFAIYWIKAEINEFILKNWKIVKIATTKSHRKLFFNLRKIKKQIGWFSNGEVRYIAKKFCVSKNDVREMESRMFSKDVVVNFPDEYAYYYKSFLSFLKLNKIYDFTYILEKDNWNKYIFKKLKIALSFLDKRSRYIIISRWLINRKKFTLRKLAIRFSVSTERIRQLEKNALIKLKTILKNN